MLQKQNVNLPFAAGLDTKTDDFQVAPGKLLSLKNAVFKRGNRLQKRNGFGSLTSLPDSTSKHLSTYKGNLLAYGGSNLYAYSSGSKSWTAKGNIIPAELSTLSLIKNNTNQSQVDTAIGNGLVCTVYTDQNNSNLAQPVYKFAVADLETGQNIINPTAIVPTGGSVVAYPRVFSLGFYFLVTFVTNIGGAYHLQYIAVSQNGSSIGPAVDLESNVNVSHPAFDGVVANSSLFLAYNASDVGGAIRVTKVDSFLNAGVTVPFATRVGTIISVTADSTPYVYVSFYDSGSSTGYTLAVDQMLNTVLAPTQIIAAGSVPNITSSASGGVAHISFETPNNYAYDSSISSHYVSKLTINIAGSVSSTTIFCRSVGLASKQFVYNGTNYVLCAYQSAYQPTYFLLNVDSSTAASPTIVGKLAYGNGGGYALSLPSVAVVGDSVYIGYLVKDLITSVNKNTNVPVGTQTNGIYAQTGVNLAVFNLNPTQSATAEIGEDLHIGGGFLWMYDGFTPVEHGFWLYPDNVEATWSAAGGSIHAQPDGATNTNAYFYQVAYEWSDNEGNIFRSAPSIPISVTTTGNGIAGSITLNIPTLRLTYKTSNPVKIVVYRWSVAQQTYYQVTSLTTPTLNSLTSDSVAFVDTLADASILGNAIIYTTGGVIENVAPPATNIMTIFDNRLWVVSSEDPNLLWFSKQVIEATPVEMSDLFTIYVPSSLADKGASGPITCLSVMDDKLIIFKKNSIFYINGAGPDNTGSSNQYSNAIFVNASVGCINSNSIVITPQGIMFQTTKGIWLLGRDMGTSYIGAPVEQFNSSNVLSAVVVPDTNQVRFSLDTGEILMYDYYYGQWGIFSGVPSISSVIFENAHTIISSLGDIFQETPDVYLDGANPVLMSLQTGWMNFSGLQGFERIYEVYLLATYLTPHTLNVSFCYDYNSSPLQTDMIVPDNFAGTWGSLSLWGDAQTWGGPGNIEQWRIFTQTKKCQAISLIIQEFYDPSLGVPAGAGLILHGMDWTVSTQVGRPKLSASRQVG